ncbi:MAG: excinuclease ABC subunit UvrB [Planctomycetes bacterium]|nr:excinuclease ABC subunit UvrB [Planctomycetota bacterium]MCP4772482.1 excinuclease ABC subunit UvrB [Planctomycetota bacterium]MCP4860125.1 excinuclease ABC subunit UvrB [Planctomycetota bacterium]
MTSSFSLVSDFEPRGDQPQAIESLVDGLQDPAARRILLGVTGSGKTFTVANVIQRLQVPTLVLAPNKTLAGQLYGEFRELFPHNAVEYFVSYYDYFQPEAYIPSSDTYIEKDARINDRIDRLRNGATAALLTRKDVIVVASVSCIYGLGDPETYKGLALNIREGTPAKREDIVRGLVRTQHARAEIDFRPGSFRLRGPAVEVWPIHEQDRMLRIELDGDLVDALMYIDPLTGEILEEPREVSVYPVGHYVQPEDRIPQAQVSIREEMEKQVRAMRIAGREIEAERLERRTMADLEDLEELGYCSGIENYSAHFEGRAPGQPPFTLLNYFPRDFLCVIDESHVTLPQVYGMVRGDQARKRNLIEYGFRLESALENRPLAEKEFEPLVGRVMYLSATPGYREQAIVTEPPVEQIVRPTGLVDPPVEIRPAMGQVEDALASIKPVIDGGERVLVTTLTKRSAEDLTEFLQENSIKARYLHADIDTLERSELLRDLRLGVFDVLVGINLLREGLDLPEVALVLVLDADREGFLRSTTSLIQTCGRAARNAHGRVVLYADKMTKSINATLEEADRRREIQEAYNKEHGIVPRTIKKRIVDSLATMLGSESEEDETHHAPREEEIDAKIAELEKQMLVAASSLDFEQAIRLRDEVRRLEAARLEFHS